MNTFFAINRGAKVAALLSGFSCWEHLQGAFRCGIALTDTINANGIGRAKSKADFIKRAKQSGFVVLS